MNFIVTCYIGNEVVFYRIFRSFKKAMIFIDEATTYYDKITIEFEDDNEVC